jgi:OmpA-OmpF porin, OOP family
MSTFNLLDMAKSYFSNELVNKVSSHLGEDEGGISKAISAIFPSVIGTIADKATSTPDAADAVAKMANTQNEGGILNSIAGFLHPDTSHNMLGQSSGLIGSLFGNGGASNMLTSLVSNFAGIKSTSVGTILSMAVPTILGLVGKHAKDNNLSSNAMATMLGEQKKSAMSMLPDGFSLASLGGSAGNTVSSAAANTYRDVEEKAGGGMKWLLPVLLLAGLAAGAYYLFTKKSGDTHTTVNTSDTTNAAKVEGSTAALPKVTLDSVTGFVNYDLGATMDLEIPGGKLTGVATNGFEANLVNFLKTGTIDTVNKKANWFTIHDVQFVSGKTTYASPKSMAQVKNVAAILKAYPNAILKVGGYTDITGEAAKNKALSQDRANQLMKDIIANGAAATQIKEAVGYGSEFAEAKAGDKEGMARDRRTAAKVTVK